MVPSSKMRGRDPCREGQDAVVPTYGCETCKCCFAHAKCISLILFGSVAALLVLERERRVVSACEMSVQDCVSEEIKQTFFRRQQQMRFNSGSLFKEEGQLSKSW